MTEDVTVTINGEAVGVLRQAAGKLRDATFNNSVDAGHLRAFLERIERLEEEKKAIADDVKEVFAEAKGTGYDVKIMRKILAIRKMDRDKRVEEESLLDLYLSALGEQISLL